MNFIIEERPVKLFGFVIWYRKVKVPTTNELMRRATKEQQ